MSAPEWPQHAESHGACVLLIDADADLAVLVQEWLAPEGLRVQAVSHAAGRDLRAFNGALRLALVIVDLPFPSPDRVDALRAQLGRHGHAPLLVLSSTVFASVDCCGPAARSLGADGLLPKPTSAEALRRAVRQLTRS